MVNTYASAAKLTRLHGVDQKRRTAKGLVNRPLVRADRKDLAAYVSLSQFTCQRAKSLQITSQRYTHR